MYMYDTSSTGLKSQMCPLFKTQISVHFWEKNVEKGDTGLEGATPCLLQN